MPAIQILAPTIQQILAKKNLAPNLFDLPYDISLEMPLEAHVAWIYQHIYSKPYTKQSKLHTFAPEYPDIKIARVVHGIQHVTRAAIYVPIFANLYRHYGNNEDLIFNNEDIKLLQIAALFHDSAREDEEEDLWDQESALFFFYYATRVLQLTKNQAGLLAEAIANKDAQSEYYELSKESLGSTSITNINKINENFSDDLNNINPEGAEKEYGFVAEEKYCFVAEEYCFVAAKKYSPYKNIYQKIIHDADCLEIIRARDHFDASYLDFYKDIASAHDDAFQVMAKLITEARSLIEYQGDGRGRTDLRIKSTYEHPNAYVAIMSFIQQNASHFPLLVILSNKELLNAKALQENALLNCLASSSPDYTASLTRKLQHEFILARGIAAPASFYVTSKDETAARLEVRKILRRQGIETRTKKLGKMGSPHRSISLIGNGASVYAGQGFLIFDPQVQQISAIYDTDKDTGRGKKEDLQLVPMSNTEKLEKLTELQKQNKMGGTSKRRPNVKVPDTHNELLYLMTQADAIYFTQDPTLFNYYTYGNPYPSNPYAHYLQALFLQNEYEQAARIRLPIYEYSGLHNFIKPAPNYNEEQIIEMWVTIVGDIIRKEFSSKGYLSLSLEEIKIKAIDGYLLQAQGHHLLKKQTPLDANYSPELQYRLNVALEKAKEEYWRHHHHQLQLLAGSSASPILEIQEGEPDDSVISPMPAPLDHDEIPPTFLFTMMTSAKTKALASLMVVVGGTWTIYGGLALAGMNENISLPRAQISTVVGATLALAGIGRLGGGFFMSKKMAEEDFSTSKSNLLLPS